MFGTWGDEQVRVVYDYYVDTLVPCLEARGFEVGDVPTWEAFRSTWVPDGSGGLSAGEGSWAPYTLLIDVIPPEEWDAVEAACPQNPTDEMLFPDESG
jgi:hypothetical protein